MNLYVSFSAGEIFPYGNEYIALFFVAADVLSVSSASNYSCLSRNV